MRGIDRTFLLALARIFWGNGIGKAGGTVALIGATSAFGILPNVVVAVAALAGLKIPIPDVPLWFSGLLVGLGLAAAAFGTYAQRAPPTSEPGQIHSHDRELFARYQALVSEGDLDFLRNHDFGVPFAFRWVDGIMEIGGQWHGPRFEFTDQEFEAAFRAVKQDAREFSSAVLEHVHPSRNNPTVATTKPDLVSAQYSDWHRAANKKLNDLATRLANTLEGFERLLHGRLR